MRRRRSCTSRCSRCARWWPSRRPSRRLLPQAGARRQAAGEVCAWRSGSRRTVRCPTARRCRRSTATPPRRRSCSRPRRRGALGTTVADASTPGLRRRSCSSRRALRSSTRRCSRKACASRSTTPASPRVHLLVLAVLPAQLPTPPRTSAAPSLPARSHRVPPASRYGSCSRRPQPEPHVRARADASSRASAAAAAAPPSSSSGGASAPAPPPPRPRRAPRRKRGEPHANPPAAAGRRPPEGRPQATGGGRQRWGDIQRGAGRRGACGGGASGRAPRR